MRPAPAERPTQPQGNARFQIGERFTRVADASDRVQYRADEADKFGLYPIEYWLSPNGWQEAPKVEATGLDAWFVRDALGDVVGHIRCDAPDAASNPSCRQTVRFGETSASAGFNRSELGRWREVSAQMRRYFNCAIKAGFPALR